MNDTVVAILFLLALLIGLPVLILRSIDKGGMIGVFLSRSLGVICLLFGLGICAWIVYNLFSATPDSPSNISPLMMLGIPLSLTTFGAAWFFRSGPGIEKADIDFDAPELRAAVEEARTTLPYFIAEVSQHVDEAYIKFPLLTDSGCTEHIWAYVHHYQDAVFNVSLANDPYDQEGEYETRRNVPESEIEDWQIMLPDGSLKGAYSLIAAFRYLENQGKPLTKTMRKQKALLVDADT